MNKLKENPGSVVAVIKAKSGLISTIISIALIVVAVIAVQRAWNYSKLEKENKELQSSISEMTNQLENYNQVQEQLAYAESQVTLYQESTNALTEQVAGLNAINEDLNNQLEELLNVKETVPVITRNELDKQISALSELVTTKYFYRNATQKDDDKTWLWGWTMPFSATSLLATYDGTITASIDLKEVRFSVNQQTKTITVTMPKSKIYDHNIPQETINVLSVKDNLFNKVTFNDYNKFISAEKNVMEQVAIEQGLLTQADEDAKEIIEAFLRTVPGIDAYMIKFN